MPPSARRHFLILIGAFIASSCSPPPPSSPEDNGADYPISSEIGQYWEQKGGEAAFGPPLSPGIRDGPIVRQTFQNVEIVYDPQSGEVALSPIGRLLGLAEPAVPMDQNPDLYFDRTGHNLYPGFLQRYQELGGEEVLGAPIAEFGVERGRLLQYFENGGFFRDADSPPLAVELMSLGYALRIDQTAGPPLDPNIVIPEQIFNRPFGLFLDSIGGEVVVGPALGDAYLTSDGTLEQVYERAVLYSTIDDSQSVRFRPLGADDFQLQGSAEAVAEPGSIFFPQTGHNVRWAFADFYRIHQGQSLLGFPLEEAYLQGDELIQAFENGVLVYRYDLPPQVAVQLAPLGLDYTWQVVLNPDPTPAVPPPPTATAVVNPPGNIYLIEARVDQVVLPVSDLQRVEIEVKNSEGQPIASAQPIVLVQSPSEEFYLAAPQTDQAGIALLEFGIENLAPGEIINFEVALADEEGIGFTSGQFIGGISPQP